MVYMDAACCIYGRTLKHDVLHTGIPRCVLSCNDALHSVLMYIAVLVGLLMDKAIHYAVYQQ